MMEVWKEMEEGQILVVAQISSFEDNTINPIRCTQLMALSERYLSVTCYTIGKHSDSNSFSLKHKETFVITSSIN